MKFISRVILPLLLIIYIGFETWLKLHHQSLCLATGCKLAGELLRFPSIYLNYLGLVATIAILLLGILSIFRSSFEKLYFIALYSAISFESIMIGYQIFANPEPCLFCLGVYSGLILIALFSRPKYLLYALPAIFSIFFALSDLAIPKNQSLIKKDGLYLIASNHCPHCLKVKAYLAKNKISYTQLSVTSPSVRYLAKSLGIDAIPILLKRHNGKSTIIYGDEPIISSFKAKKLNPKNDTKRLPLLKNPNKLYANPNNGGCKLDAVEEGNGCHEDTPTINLR